MARTQLSVKASLGSYPSLPVAAHSQQLVFAAVDAVDGGEFVTTGEELLLVWNTTGGPATVNINSVKDAFGRVGDIDGYTVSGGKVAVLGPFKRDGWAGTGYKVHVEASAVGVEFALVRPTK